MTGGQRPRYVGLKVDVDTRKGMEIGVPRLLEAFGEAGVSATFFLSFGPDNAGKAIWDIFRRPGFLRKMVRTRAPSLYGWRTLLSGTLLPARLIASALGDLTRRIEDEGHEVAVHCWDHRLWQDHLTELAGERIREQVQLAFEAFEKILGRPPAAFAAPAWFMTPESLAVQDDLGLLYASDVRGGDPCFISVDGRRFSTLQIPTTQPCLEELMAVGGRDPPSSLDRILSPEGTAGMVVPLHAEVEGGRHLPFLRSLLERVLGLDARVMTLQEIASEALAEGAASLSTIPCGLGTIAGRAGRVLTPSETPRERETLR